MNELLFLDTETTDLKEGRLVELAYLLCSPDGPSGELTIEQILVKPPVRISYEAMAMHHITESQVINQPIFQQHPSFETIEQLARNNILVAHNAPYDIDVLEREGIAVPRFIDTRRVAMHLRPEATSFSLQYLRYYLGCNVAAQAHSASGDVAVLLAVFAMLLAELDKQGDFDTNADKIAEMERLSTAPALLTIAPRILKKHAGKAFHEINRIDRSYILWACAQEWEGVDIREDLLHTLKHWRAIKSV